MYIVVYKACSEWGEWTDCSATCGDGKHTRSRTCNHDKQSATGREGQDTTAVPDNGGKDRSI